MLGSGLDAEFETLCPGCYFVPKLKLDAGVGTLC
jgi:hypothetical protein